MRCCDVIQRGRKSAASKEIAVIAFGAAALDRLAPPANLLPDEAAAWREAANGWPADDLRGLTDFCRHTAMARRLSTEIDTLPAAADARARARLLRNRRDEAKQAAAIERSARSSLRVRRAAPAVAAARALRPWQGWGDATLDAIGPPLPAGWYYGPGAQYRPAHEPVRGRRTRA
jgi:hypothetical protein